MMTKGSSVEGGELKEGMSVLGSTQGEVSWCVCVCVCVYVCSTHMQTGLLTALNSHVDANANGPRHSFCGHRMK